MAGLRDLDSGKIYIGPEEPKKLDKSVETKNGDKPFDGTLAVTGPIFLGAHSDKALGVVNMGTALGDFQPIDAGKALDIEGDVKIVGDGGGKQGVNALVIEGDVLVKGKMDCGNKGVLAARFNEADLKGKTFDMPHPNQDGYRLRHACIEGPEIAVYCRGRCTGTEIILPSYWKNLVHEDSITVQLTPIGVQQKIIVKEFDNEKVVLESDIGNIDCFYMICGERKDVNPLLTEYQGKDYPDPNWKKDSHDETRNMKDPQYDYGQNTKTVL